MKKLNEIAASLATSTFRYFALTAFHNAAIAFDVTMAVFRTIKIYDWRSGHEKEGNCYMRDIALFGIVFTSQKLVLSFTKPFIYMKNTYLIKSWLSSI